MCQCREASDLLTILNDPMYESQCRLTANNKFPQTPHARKVNRRVSAIVVFVQELHKVKPSHFCSTVLKACRH